MGTSRRIPERFGGGAPSRVRERNRDSSCLEHPTETLAQAAPARQAARVPADSPEEETRHAKYLWLQSEGAAAVRAARVE